MIVELHLIQNFAPSCLNRDDTNTPKDCEFGGYRRARISSQCIKRAVRKHFEKDSLFSSDEMAVRTKRIVDGISDFLVQDGRQPEQIQKVVKNALESIKLKVKEDKGGVGKTEYLLYLGARELNSFAEELKKYWIDILELSPEADKRAKKKEFPKEIKNALLATLDGGKAIDLALFGRMIADLPEKKIDAACQVAHAISTNKVNMDFDFYTAIDDLQPDDTTGAGMMGTVQFNSSCFYRYANIDMEQLRENLLGKKTAKANANELADAEELARRTLKAFLKASVWAIPTGKQNSMAAQNLPDAVFAVVRGGGLPMSLANAFVKPVKPGNDNDLIQASISKMDNYWSCLQNSYGVDDIKTSPIHLVCDIKLDCLQDKKVSSFKDLMEEVMGAVSFKETK